MLSRKLYCRERRIENQQSQETGDNEKDWRHRDSGFKGGHRGHLRGECYFSGRSPDTSGSGQAGTGTTPSDGAQVITRWEAQNVIRMCETIILELFTLGLTLSHPGQAPPSVLHLPGGARAVFSQQDISSFATRSLHYRVISFLLFSHQRKYYLFIINTQENMMIECMYVNPQKNISILFRVQCMKIILILNTPYDERFVWE